jgi:hypothetical protein
MALDTIKKNDRPVADKPKRVQKPIDKKLYLFYRATTGADGMPDVEIIDVQSDKRKALDTFMSYRADATVKMKEYKLPKRSDTAEIAEAVE